MVRLAAKREGERAVTSALRLDLGDGLGRLGFEAAVARDYPVVFGTLFAFSLMVLVIGIITDLTYVFIDPRIDFERRG